MRLRLESRLVALLGGLAAASLGAGPASAAPAPPALDSETARTLSREALEARVAAAVGARLTLVEAKHFGSRFRATARMRPRAYYGVCTASQLTMWFVPEPDLAPKGTMPGAIHVSRLPMEIRETEAAQVYRRGPPGLSAWKPWLGADPCGTVDPALPFFLADGAAAAAAALALFDQVVALARDNAAALPLECYGGKRESCLETVAALGPDAIEAVRGCGPAWYSAEQQARCVSIALRTEQTTASAISMRHLDILLSAASDGVEPSVEQVRFSTSIAVS
ncbi:hypothetical protein E2493_20390 [Sphingomonas parva]|uniref:Uncharacterized protein n=1 Tax=Sphingomonas parva TaxID=2555898 RepID=A0A4Y8ZLS4_9SPHN|nr:hypothetical protein [Sphingomonas parva]TFI56397.1 hypothetical protein E2493_20390 [Sphingomonas parva]